METRNQKIENIILYINKLIEIIKVFYEIKHQNDIQPLINLKNEIEKGMVNYIEKKEIIEKINEIYKLVPDFNKKLTLKSSKFFTTFFNIKKMNNQEKNEDEIFKETEEDFKKLQFFFKPNWINIFEDSMILQCYQALKHKNYTQIFDELYFVKDYFDIKERGDKYINKIVNEILSFQDDYKISNLTNQNKIYKELKSLKKELKDKNQIIEEQKIK